MREKQGGEAGREGRKEREMLDEDKWQRRKYSRNRKQEGKEEEGVLSKVVIR